MARRMVAPLSGSFMVSAVVGLAISWIFVLKISPAWGAAFIIFFVIMFVASVVSMTHAPLPEERHMKKKIKE